MRMWIAHPGQGTGITKAFDDGLNLGQFGCIGFHLGGWKALAVAFGRILASSYQSSKCANLSGLLLNPTSAHGRFHPMLSSTQFRRFVRSTQPFSSMHSRSCAMFPGKFSPCNICAKLKSSCTAKASLMKVLKKGQRGVLLMFLVQPKKAVIYGDLV